MPQVDEWRSAVKRVLRMCGYPPDKQESETNLVIHQAELLCAELATGDRLTRPSALSPMDVVCRWVGNGALVTQKHHLQVTEANFERAA